MTVKEFYEYCVEKHIEDYKIFVREFEIYPDWDGIFLDYKGLTNKEIEIDHNEEKNHCIWVMII